MTKVSLDIVSVRFDPQVDQRLQSGNFRINQELNQEWIDLKNNGPYTLNLQGRIIACIKRHGLRNAPTRFECLRYAQLRSSTTIPLKPGQKVRIFSGEQPRSSTHISDQDQINLVLWLVQSTYLWLPTGNEAHIYTSLADLRNQRTPLSRFFLN